MTAKTLDQFTGATCSWDAARRTYTILAGTLEVNGEIAAPPGGWAGVVVYIVGHSNEAAKGAIRFVAGATGTIGGEEVPVIIYEDALSKGYGEDNYKKNASGDVDNAGAGARFAGDTTNNVVFDNVHWYAYGGSVKGRSDFDFAQGDSNNNGPAITCRGLHVFISGPVNSFNHIASKNVKFEVGSNADFALRVTNSSNPASLELTSGLVNAPKGWVLDNTHPSSNEAQFAVQPTALPENGWLELDGLVARSVSVVSGGSNTSSRGFRLTNPAGLPDRKPWGTAYDANLEVQRDQLFVFDKATDGRLYADAQHASSADGDVAIDSNGRATIRLITQVSPDSFSDWTNTNSFKFHAVGRSFQKYFSGSTAITLDNSVPTRNIVVVKDEFPNGDAVTARSGTDGVATASELYRVIKDYEQDNPAVPSLSESIAKINSSGHIVLGDSIELRLDSSASELIAISSGVMTIKVDSGGITADKGISLIDAGTTNAVPAATKGFINMPLRDSSGTSSQLTITAHANERVGVFTPTGTALGSYAFTADGSHTFQISAANSSSDTKIGLVRAGYEYAAITGNLSAGGAFSVAFEALSQELGPDGTPVYKSAADESNVEAVEFGATGDAIIDIGDGWADVQGIYKKFHDEVDTAAGTKFAAFRRERLGIAVDPLAGNSLYLGANIKLRRHESGDTNAAVAAGVYSSGDRVDESNGDVNLKPGSDIGRIQEALLTDFDLDPEQAGTQSVAGLLTQITTCAAQMQEKVDVAAGILGGKSAVSGDTTTYRDLDDTKDVRSITTGSPTGTRTAATTPAAGGAVGGGVIE